jgi:hypothetical protein
MNQINNYYFSFWPQDPRSAWALVVFVAILGFILIRVLSK